MGTGVQERMRQLERTVGSAEADARAAKAALVDACRALRKLGAKGKTAKEIIASAQQLIDTLTREAASLREVADEKIADAERAAGVQP